MPKKLNAKEAKIRLGKFCAFRERSPNETLEKLYSFGLSIEDAEAVLEDLVAADFVNEQRFANAYCHDKFHFNHWGKTKIRAAIFSHKIASDKVERALARIDENQYREKLIELLTKKWQLLESEEELKKKQKTVNYLAAKGYEMDLIWQGIKQISEKSGK